MFVALTQFLILIILVHNSLEYNHSLKIKNHIHKRSSSNDKIDEILKVSNCGRISPRANSRVINAKESKTWYPWMTFIGIYKPIYHLLPNGDPDKNRKEYKTSRFRCTGSIISSRTILTAGHCICKSEVPSDSVIVKGCRKRLYPLSKTKPGFPINQHITLRDKNGLSVKDEDIELMAERKEIQKSDSFNHLTVKIGSRDHTTGVTQTVKFAYVMYPDHETREKLDIGLIILEKEIDTNVKYPDFEVSPICLPTSADITNDVEVTTAGWGMLVDYHDRKKDIDKAVRSTCMTNELGDLRYQYEACDLRELEKNNYECHKTLPPSVKAMEKECDSYWKQVDDWLEKASFGKADQLYDQLWVKKAKPNELTARPCYKKEHFLTKGWCRPIGWQSNGGWGICTESCKYLKNFVDTTSADYKKVTPTSYHTAKFKLLDRNSHQKFGEKYCDDNKQELMKRKQNEPDVLDRLNRMKDKEMCTVQIKPETIIGYFSLQKPKFLRFNKRKIDFNPDEKNETPGTIKRQAKPGSYYTGLCMGDSGASLWKTELGVSTVLGVESYGVIEDICIEPSYSHKINHKDVLLWISENWVK